MPLSRKTLVIIGNGDLPRDLSAEIDAADFVLRFNKPKVGPGGTRTDLLMLINSSKQMQDWLEDPDFVRSPFFEAAGEVILVHHPEIIEKYCVQPNILSRLKGRRADWTWAAINIFGGAGKEIRILPPQFYLEACEELGITQANLREVFPSTGYLGIRYILQNFPCETWDIKLCGFSWEGWRRHNWADERRWVEDRMEEGRLSFLT
ncbi:urease accessory protein [Brucella endophytica]|uniref:Urease accessory protein n=1 Tax=Brucella endophytica TaxID=1963359 RepID=A0A916W9B9_9HYPH|nr:glycosyltransferase family 29 protein [Brucella endophytica]GGA78802.1 urease accessory protein [Brucella endophytica]